MNKKLYELSIIGVDKDGITKDDAFPHAYRYPFKLSEEPDELWINLFEQATKYSFDSMKRRAYVEGDCIVVIIADSDNISDQKRIAEQAIQRTNQEYKRIYQELQRVEQQQRDVEKKRDDTIEKLKRDADNLKFD